MRAVVTGGAGFIGSHLVAHLAALDHHVVVLDNLATGRSENLSSMTGNQQVEFRLVDVADDTRLDEHLAGADWVFHLAALADIVMSVQHPLRYHHANVDATVAVLEAARSVGVRRFIYAASSSCYGIPDIYPTPETTPVCPMYPYALTKYVSEQYVLHWAKVYKLPAVSLRLFNVYGPRARTSGTYGAVFGVFLAQRLAGEPLTIVGNGEQSRDFTFVTDVARAFVAAAESDLVGSVLNVGSRNTYTINYLANLIGGEVVHVSKRPGEPDRTHADISKIHRLLEWEPKVSFEEGVRIMLAHKNEWRGSPVWNPDSISEATREWFRYLSS